MNKIILASLAVAAMLASCSKESTVDVAITSTQIPIQFSTYASSATTKGNPVDTNIEFKGTETNNTFTAQFEVSAYADTNADNNVTKYFSFSTVKYDTSAWTNSDDMYYPNTDATLYYGAYYPSGAVGLGTPDYVYTYDYNDGVSPSGAHSLTIPYTVLGDYPSSNAKTVSDQVDLMYAITEKGYTAPTAAESGNSTTLDATETVNLHFKHALTQVAFTATKDSDLDVTVNSITLCNIVNGGTFTATTVTDTSYAWNAEDAVPDASVEVVDMGSWTTLGTTYNHYVAALALTGTETSVTVSEDTNSNNPTALTDDDDALMLIPQALTAWSTTADGTGASGTATLTSNNSYLAINCIVYHTGSTEPIINGIVYVPFSTSGITYASGDDTFNAKYLNAWAPGYKITYNLDFGGGYTDTTTPSTIPDPGKTPDPDDLVPTLRAITYTTTIDEWKTVEAGTINL